MFGNQPACVGELLAGGFPAKRDSVAEGHLCAGACARLVPEPLGQQAGLLQNERAVEQAQ